MVLNDVIWGVFPRLPIDCEFSNRPLSAALKRKNSGNGLPMLKPLFLDKLAP